MFEKRVFLDTRGDEPGRALVCVFGSEVSADSAALVEDEAFVILNAIIGRFISNRLHDNLQNLCTYDVWNLPEWLVCYVLGVFVLAFPEINFHKLEWDFLLVENSTDATGAGGHAVAVELENHCALEWM